MTNAAVTVAHLWSSCTNRRPYSYVNKLPCERVIFHKVL